ncbi:osteoclast stimulatory transmembrane protein [Macrotis lagotis]|uniref:osteoclast stimulatory transmembrane protein n=1 Tax=Macrotis lagotis TaxID=92651 RepID=UPI003D68F7A3
MKDAEEQLIRKGRCLWHSRLLKVQELLLEAWKVYAKPVPGSCGQLFIQLLLCALISATASGLAFNWLTVSLMYPVKTSAIGAMACGFLLFLVLGLVHPVRCLLALTVPTLGMRQGRRLLLSSGFAELATHVVPNILANVGVTMKVLRCVAQGSLESLLNSTHQLEVATMALDQAVGRAGGRRLTLETSSNCSALYVQMLVVTQRVYEDISALEALVRGLALSTNRVLAGVFILSLLSESMWYLKGYLTNLKFDNLYKSKHLEQLLKESQDNLLAASPSALVLKVTGLRLSQAEIFQCLFRLAFLVVPLGAMTVIVAADYVAFLLAHTAVDWTQKLPTLPIHLSIKYDAKYTVLPFISFIFNQPSEGSSLDIYQGIYKWELRFTSASCQLHPAYPPQCAAALVTGLLFLFASATVFLETYARRLGHRVAASFFQAQEEQRAQYLFAHLQQNYQKQQVEPIQAKVFSVPHSSSMDSIQTCEELRIRGDHGML